MVIATARSDVVTACRCSSGVSRVSQNSWALTHAASRALMGGVPEREARKSLERLKKLLES